MTVTDAVVIGIPGKILVPGVIIKLVRRSPLCMIISVLGKPTMWRVCKIARSCELNSLVSRTVNGVVTVDETEFTYYQRGGMAMFMSGRGVIAWAGNVFPTRV